MKKYLLVMRAEIQKQQQYDYRSAYVYCHESAGYSDDIIFRQQDTSQLFSMVGEADILCISADLLS